MRPRRSCSTLFSLRVLARHFARELEPRAADPAALDERPALVRSRNRARLRLPPDEQNNIDIYKANRLATVNVTSIVYQRDLFFQVFPQKGIGSGFIINDDGEIVTNNHVISGSHNITVTLSDQKQYKATVLGIDRRSDLAMLQIHADSKLPFVRLGDSDHLLVGQKVLAIGNPFGLEGTLTTGIVSSLGRSLQNEDGNTLEGLIQTDAAINPGNSGGPLLDSRGNVIGINTAIFGSQTASGEAGSIGIGFAMPINRAKAMLEEFRTTGHISHPVLGYRESFSSRAIWPKTSICPRRAAC